MSESVPVLGISPSEGDVIFEVDKIKAVDEMEFQDVAVGRQHRVADESPGVVVLELIIVGERCSVGIEQSVRSLVSVHFESLVLRGEHALLISEEISASPFSVGFRE